MAEKEVVRNRKLTDKDLICIKLYLPELVRTAKELPKLEGTHAQIQGTLKKLPAYSELIERVASPDSPRSVGRRLTWLRFFTRPRNLPDLASLVVKKGTDEVGPAFDVNAREQQAACSNCPDWHETEFEIYFSEMEKMHKADFTLAKMEEYFGVQVTRLA